MKANIGIFIIVICYACKNDNLHSSSPEYRIEYHSNGMIRSKSEVKNNKLNGCSISWYDNGVLRDSSFFRNDSIIGKNVSFYRNGIKNYEIYYNDKHLMDSIHIVWYEDGRVMYTSQVKDGIFNGKTKRFSQSGDIISEVRYRNGKKNDTSFYYAEYSRLKAIEIYDQDELVYRVEY